jgi:hypothetical protein
MRRSKWWFTGFQKAGRVNDRRKHRLPQLNGGVRGGQTRVGGPGLCSNLPKQGVKLAKMGVNGTSDHLKPTLTIGKPIDRGG